MGNCLCKRNARRTLRKITLLLVGLDNAGKTTAAKNLLGDNVDDVVPTVGFSVLSLTYLSYSVMIYDLGGGPQIRDIWQHYFTDVHGVIFVIDSSDTARMEEGKAVLMNLLSHEKVSGKPVLVLANKQDQEGALDELDIVERFDLDALVNRYKCPTLVEMCTANMGKKNQMDPAIHGGYKWLMSHIIDNYAQLNGRVVKDMALQKELDDMERQQRRERVKKMREERGENGAMGLQDIQEEIVSDPFRPVGQVISELNSLSHSRNPQVTLVRNEAEGITPQEPPVTESNKELSNVDLHESPTSGYNSPTVGHNTEASLELQLNRSMSNNSNASDRIILVKESPHKIKTVDNTIAESGKGSASSSVRDLRVKSGGMDPVSRLKSEETLVDRELLDRRRGSQSGLDVVLVRESYRSIIIKDGEHPSTSSIIKSLVQEKSLFSSGRDPFLVPAHSNNTEKTTNMNPSITEFVKDQLKMEQKKGRRKPLLRSNKTVPESASSESDQSTPPSALRENGSSLPSARSLHTPLSPLKKVTLLPPLKPMSHSVEGGWTHTPFLPNPDVSWAIVTSGKTKVEKTNGHEFKDESENTVRG